MVLHYRLCWNIARLCYFRVRKRRMRGYSKRTQKEDRGYEGAMLKRKHWKAKARRSSRVARRHKRNVLSLYKSVSCMRNNLPDNVIQILLEGNNRGGKETRSHGFPISSHKYGISTFTTIEGEDTCKSIAFFFIS